MKKASYPQIGQVVNYVRQVNEGIETGRGIVLAVCLDAERRLMCHLEGVKPDNERHKFNVDVECLNPDADFVNRFEALCADIKRLSEEGNSKIADIVSEYNGRVDNARSSFFGKPVELDTL